jgi:hypothetical protein
MKRILSLFFFLLISGLSSWGQPCREFLNVCMELGPKENDKSFKYNFQSKSALFEKGQKSILKFVVYRGVDYKISFCSEEAFDGEVSFVLIGKDSAVLFDNSKEDMAQAFEYESKYTGSLTLVVTMPGTRPTKEEKNLPGSKGCVGVVIKHRMSAKTGF